MKYKFKIEHISPELSIDENESSVSLNEKAQKQSQIVTMAILDLISDFTEKGYAAPVVFESVKVANTMVEDFLLKEKSLN